MDGLGLLIVGVIFIVGFIAYIKNASFRTWVHGQLAKDKVAKKSVSPKIVRKKKVNPRSTKKKTTKKS